jgi:hypothetical protein
MTGHLPDRPSWACRTCDNPWPCVTSRLQLRAEYDGHSVPLMMYLNSQMIVAAGDLCDKLTAGDLLRRFLGWTGSDVL